MVRGQSILNTPDKVRPGIELIFLGVDILAGGLLCWVAFSNFDTDLHNVCRWLPLAPSPYLKPAPDSVLIDSLMWNPYDEREFKHSLSNWDACPQDHFWKNNY